MRDPDISLIVLFRDIRVRITMFALRMGIHDPGFPEMKLIAFGCLSYILGMQRIPYGAKDKKPASGEKRRPAVFMLHGKGLNLGGLDNSLILLLGFMMCSEALLIRKKSEDSLPLVLAENG